MRISLATSLFTSHLTSTSNSLYSSISMTTVNFMITDWEALVTGLVNPKKDKYFANNGLFISFQLTPLRQEILQNVRKARALDHIGKFKVDSNGRIFASKIKGTPGVKNALPWTSSPPSATALQCPCWSGRKACQGKTVKLQRFVSSSAYMSDRDIHCKGVM